MKLHLFLAPLLLLTSSAFALGEEFAPAQDGLTEIDDGLPDLPASDEYPAPWFTGPLLTPSGHVVPAGFINFEPYAIALANLGGYDSDWNSFSTDNFYVANFQAPLFIGLTDWSNILVVPQASWQGTQGVSSMVFNDFIFEFDVALLSDTSVNHIPGLKIYVQEVFPTGQYQKGDPCKLGTDFGGDGTFRTTVGFVITRLFHIYKTQYLALRFNSFYGIPTRVCVKGLNTYGGAPDTKGTVNPGQNFGAMFGLEYSFTQNFAFAFDAFASYNKTTTFKGFPGTEEDGTPAIVGGPESFQFSIAPALEFLQSESFGVIAGAWFTLAGKNSGRFVAGMLAINYFGPIRHLPEHKFRSTGGGGAP